MRQPVFWLLLYTILSLIWTAAQAAMRWAGVGSLALDPALYGMLVLAVFFLHMSRSFLRLERGGYGWWIAGGLWLGAALVVDAPLVALPAEPVPGIGLDRVAALWLGLGTAVPVVVSLVLTAREHRAATSPLHRNRITYWYLVLALVAAGSMLCLLIDSTLGTAIYVLATPVAAYVVVTPQLPDVRHGMRRLLSYMLTTILSVAIYTGGFVATQELFQAVPGYGPLVAGASMALVLALIFRPLLSLVQGLVNRLISGSGYDPAHIVREYSMRISHIVDLERLVHEIESVAEETFHVRRLVLFLVHATQQAADQQEWTLESVGLVDGGHIRGTLASASPLIAGLQAGCRPLTQYEIDMLPRYRDLSLVERTWLASLSLDVYVPIYVQDQWIGLLGLGARLSGDRYFDQDLELLSTLADQTAVALENARLVGDLKRLNADLVKAYDDLDQAHSQLEQAFQALGLANRQLQELDKLKSAFIGVITHELRTPFANLDFSMQLLERYGTQSWPPDQRQQLVQLKDGLAKSKQMVDNLVGFATLISKQGEPKMEPLDLAPLVQRALKPLYPAAERKQLLFQVDLPADLPTIEGDRSRLEDAVYHLTENAIKFTEPGGVVRVHSWLEPGRLCFEVQDTGVGVPAAKLQGLWDGFSQMADPLRRGVEGLGIGLALVRLAVTAHNGQVYAESEPEIGSTFGFRIPLVETEDMPAPEPAADEEQAAEEPEAPAPQEKEAESSDVVDLGRIFAT